MKRLLLFAPIVSLLAVGLYFGVKAISPPNKSQSVQTAQMVIHPAANPGDTLVFQGLAKGTDKVKVHFIDKSPCVGNIMDLLGTGQSPPQCTAAPQSSKLAQYQYWFVTAKAAEQLPASTCPSCCHKCQVVIIDPGVVDVAQLEFGGSGSGDQEAIEIFILNDQNGYPTAINRQPHLGQPVTWFRSGSASWSIKFTDKSPCTNGSTFSSNDTDAQPSTCLVKTDRSTIGEYEYQITGGMTPYPKLKVISPPT